MAQGRGCMGEGALTWLTQVRTVPNQSSAQEGRSAAGEGAERWDQVMRPRARARTWGQVSGAAPRPRGGARAGDAAEALKAGLVG